QGHAHLGRGAPPLTRMRLVNDDRETSPAVLVADLVKDKGEFLKRCDDDLLSALDEPTQVARVLGVPHRGAHLGKLFDRIPDLPIEDAAVSDDDNGIEDGSAVPRKTDELVGQPSDGVGLATAGRMLDKIAPAHAVRPR